MTKKRFWNEQEEQPPEKKPKSKRTVFSGANSEEISQPSSEKREPRVEETRRFPRVSILRESIFWSRLPLRGPYCDQEINKVIFRNRPLFNLFRLIRHRVHENCVKFLENDVPTIAKRFGQPNIFTAKSVLMEMCEKVLKVEEEGQMYILHTPNMMDVLGRLFKENSIELKLNIHPEILIGIQALCIAKRVVAPMDELELVRDRLVRYFYFMACDLLPFLLNTYFDGKIVVINGYRPLNVLPNTLFRTVPESFSLCANMSRLTILSSKLFTRITPFSLWTSIPYEESDHLLEHLLEYGLIQLLPGAVKECLTNWMISVRRLMRRWLRNGEFVASVQRHFPTEAERFSFRCGDRRLGLFLSDVVNHLLPPSMGFPKSWKKYALEVIRRDQTNIVEPLEEFFAVSEQVSHQELPSLASLFTDSPTDQSLFYHTRIQILRFFIISHCHVIRHVFQDDGGVNLTYDGQMEEQDTDFSKYKKYEDAPLIQLPTPVETPTVTLGASEPLEHKLDPCNHEKAVEEPKLQKQWRIVQWTVLLRSSHFWNMLSVRGPYGDVHISDKLHLHRPIYNLIRLILYKFHLNCIDFMCNDLKNLMEQEYMPTPQELMRLMCEKVLTIEVEGSTYTFNVPGMTDPIERLFRCTSVRLESNQQPQLLTTLRLMCHNRKIKASHVWLQNARGCIVQHIFYMATDLLPFVYRTSQGPTNFVHILGFGSYRPVLNRIFREPIDDMTHRSMCYHLGRLQRQLLTRSVPYSMLTQFACDEKEHLLEYAVAYGLIQLLPDGVKEFLTDWLVGVRKRLRKRLKEPELFRQKVRECFGDEVPFTIASSDPRLGEFIEKTVAKVFNSKSFTIFDGKWMEYAVHVILSVEKRSLLAPYSQFFDVSDLVNVNSRAQLSSFFSRSPTDQAMLQHTIGLLHRFVILFVCYTVRHVFHFEGQAIFWKYDGKIDEEIADFDEFEEYEQNPIVVIPTPMQTPMVPDFKAPMNPTQNPIARQSGLPEICPVSLRIVETPPSFVRGSEDTGVPHVPETKWVPKPVKSEKCSFLREKPAPSAPGPSEPRPQAVKQEDLSAEVTDEELQSARALRTPSEANMSRNDDEEEIPKKWLDAYKLTLEWNEDLKKQLARIEARYEKMCI